LRDGHYLLRSNLVAEDPAMRWERYIQLTQIEAVFRSMKSELGIRPIYHQLEQRVEAHILIAFLAYSLMVTLKHRLQAHASGLTPRAVLEKLATIQMLEVWLPTTDDRWLVMPRLHATGSRPSHAVAQAEARVAAATVATFQRGGGRAYCISTEFVVKTFGMLVHKTNGLAPSDAAN
jgi:hypothetical protein